eukprot:scaffold247332_cov33-Attheya_sp.AAC.1
MCQGLGYPVNVFQKLVQSKGMGNPAVMRIVYAEIYEEWPCSHIRAWTRKRVPWRNPTGG